MRDDFDTARLASFISLPLVGAAGVPIGALAVGWASPRDLGGDHLAMLEQVATLTVRTIERLEVLRLERSVAQTLQLGLLTLDVRTTAAVVRARYRAADTGVEIGGDWYDAVEVGEGRLAVAVGDVVGRGLPAATTMGQLRAALGVASLQAADASEAVGILDRYAKHVPGARCATVAFALLDTGAETVSYLCAGHPPPLLVTPDGEVDYLPDGASWPLGIETAERRVPAASASLPAGSLLLLYTDGLVERRGESLETGLERLRSVIREHWSLPLRRLKQAIFGALVDETAADDIALVATRTCGQSRDLFVHAFRARPTELRGVRHRLAGWLTDLGVGREARDAMLLGVGEAMANAVDHGSADPDDVVRIEAAVRDGELLISVSDSGSWQPGIDGFFAGRGRGHLLMRALAEDVNVDTDQHGTIVTLRFTRPAQYA
jgi:anti-sigma regulatory factor (Ser/Thr protein kinase)